MRPIGKGSTEQHPDGACLGRDFQTLATSMDKDFQHLLSCGTARLKLRDTLLRCSFLPTLCCFCFFKKSWQFLFLSLFLPLFSCV